MPDGQTLGFRFIIKLGQESGSEITYGGDKGFEEGIENGRGAREDGTGERGRREEGEEKGRDVATRE